MYRGVFYRQLEFNVSRPRHTRQENVWSLSAGLSFPALRGDLEENAVAHAIGIDYLEPVLLRRYQRRPGWVATEL